MVGALFRKSAYQGHNLDLKVDLKAKSKATEKIEINANDRKEAAERIRNYSESGEGIRDDFLQM